MKFLCPNCRAKYQIADERVAGRSVKMKCRKCGNVIRITGPGSEAAGAAGSVSPPSGSATSERAPAPSSMPPARPARAEPSSSPPADASAGAASAEDERRSESASPPRAQVKRRPEILATMPSRSKTADRTAEAEDALSSSSPPDSGGVAKSLREAAAALGDDTDGKSAEVESGGALVGAFAQAVSAADSGVGDALATGASDWYVGINNVPVGPVRMSQLHSKAAVGAVGPESMVWREGFEDWQPLRSFPELLAVVEDAQASASSESLAATIGAGGAPGAGGLRAAGDGGVATPVAGAGALDDVVAGVSRRGSPKAAWLAVVVALVFGLTVGFVMFGGKRTVETVVKYVEVPAKNEQRASGEQAEGDSDESAEAEAEGEEQKVATKGTRRVAKAGKAASAAGAEDNASKGSGGGLKGLRALGGVRSGPDAPSEKSQASTSGRPLDSAQVQSTVARYTGSVKRSCWQPALSARDKNAPSTARVSVSIQVAPAGNVRSATSSGDPRGYRGLASCITSRVRAWRFPASSGETTVNVPFVFAAQ